MGNSEETIFDRLKEIVGESNISNDLAVRQAYGKDGFITTIIRKYRKDPLTIPDMIVLPGSTEEVQGILKIANKYDFKVLTIATGVNQCGLCIPNMTRSIVVDLKRMDKILEIDKESMSATIQPYVSIARVQAEAMKLDLWNGGTPLSPASNGLLSNIIFNGIWQSALAYGHGIRSLVNMKIVLANGGIINTGSLAMPQKENFWCPGLGPDLKGLFEFMHWGALGIITEATVKLYPWSGGEWPQEEEYDKPPLPRNHKIFFIQHPDFDSATKAMYEIAHSGIGTHLNAIPDSMNCFFTQPTQELTEKYIKEGYFPKHLIYVVVSGISSEKQILYEQSVLKEIVEETGGRFRDDLSDILSTWNADAFRSGVGTRICRRGGYTIVRMGESQIGKQEMYYKIRNGIIEKHPHNILDEETPFVYVYDRGYFCIIETDSYFDQSIYDEVDNSRKIAKEGFVESGLKDGLGWFSFIEPLTSIYGPHIGPDFHLILRKVKEIFDPKDTMNPGKLVKCEK